MKGKRKGFNQDKRVRNSAPIEVGAATRGFELELFERRGASVGEFQPRVELEDIAALDQCGQRLALVVVLHVSRFPT